MAFWAQRQLRRKEDDAQEADVVCSDEVDGQTASDPVRSRLSRLLSVVTSKSFPEGSRRYCDPAYIPSNALLTYG